MSNIKPLSTEEICRKFAIDAVPNRNGPGFVGTFAIPGKAVQTARNDDGSITVFENEDEAIAGAGEDLCAALNARTRSSISNLGYKVMGGTDLAAALAELGVSPAQFAVLCGTQQDRVMDMLDGAIPITRPMNLIVHLLRLPGAIDAAMAFTDTIKFDKREQKRESAP